MSSNITAVPREMAKRPLLYGSWIAGGCSPLVDFSKFVSASPEDLSSLDI